jgi:branched-chain amino acid transport system permease protein
MQNASSLASSPARARGRLTAEALPIGIFAVLAVLPLAALLTGGGYLVSLGARVMVFAIAAVALDLLVGYGGLISFGHAASIGLGAYAVGMLAAHGISDALVSLPAALAVSALYAFLTGIVCLRTKGVYFIMITLAFGQMAFFTASSLAPYGGDDGLTIAARSTFAGLPLIRNEDAFYYVVLVGLLGSYLFCRALVASRFGRVLRGAKENPIRVSAIGFDVYRFQLATYVIAGTLGGLSGFLLANATEFVSPAYMSWQRSGELIVMVLLGGLGSLNGAIIGTAAYLLTEEWLSGYTEDWKVIFGPILVLIVLFARGGLVGLATSLFRLTRFLRPTGTHFAGKRYVRRIGRG